MNRRLTLILIALGVAVVSFVVTAVLKSTAPAAVGANGEQVAATVGGLTFGELVLGDTIVLGVALAITFIVGATRNVVMMPTRLQSGLEVTVQVLKNRVFAVAAPLTRNRTARQWTTIAVVIGVSIIVFYYVVMVGIWHIAMALPVISVPPEHIPAWPFTNTQDGMLIADAFVLLFVFGATASLREVPGRLQGIFEMLVEFIDGMAKQMVPQAARRLFPLAATVFIFVLFANWLELIPGVDSVGIMECAKAAQNGYPATGWALGQQFQVSKLLDSGKSASGDDFAACDSLAHGGTLTAAEQTRADITAVQDAHPGVADLKPFLTTPEELAVYNQTSFQTDFQPLRPNLHIVTSFVRANATDLNFTLMLAIMAFFVIQYFGIQANGGAYFYKFINVPAMRTIANGKTPGKRVFGVIDVIVGILEGISELAKILSFGFRLFGNIFAGQALLFVIPFLVAAILPLAVYGLELFVGAIQAYVFAMLILMFTGMAMTGHHSEEEHPGQEEQHPGQNPAAEAGVVGSP